MPPQIILEKRLGIVQLCLLLTVLVFIALTRGSRGEALIAVEHAVRPLLNRFMREWGGRNLNLNGEWVSRFRSRSLNLSASGGRQQVQTQRGATGEREW